LRDAIHSLKYNKNISMGEHLSTFLINTFAAQKWIVDLVIPVPLGASRMRERGYNQASFLAFPLALAFGLPYKPAGLCRRQETSSQVSLSANDRLHNVMGAFSANEKIVQTKNILLVDDVATTSSTMFACSHALLEAGAKSVYGLTLARAVNIKNTGNSTNG
jgi:ComF family protein